MRPIPLPDRSGRKEAGSWSIDEEEGTEKAADRSRWEPRETEQKELRPTRAGSRDRKYPSHTLRVGEEHPGGQKSSISPPTGRGNPNWACWADGEMSLLAPRTNFFSPSEKRQSATTIPCRILSGISCPSVPSRVLRLSGSRRRLRHRCWTAGCRSGSRASVGRLDKSLVCRAAGRS